MEKNINAQVNDANANENEQNQQKKGNRLINWCKRHKKALILGGCAVVVTAVGIYIYKKNKAGKISLEKFGLDNADDAANFLDEIDDMPDFKDDIPVDDTAICKTATFVKHDAPSGKYAEKYDWIPDGLKAPDDALLWWISDEALNASVIPSEVGNEATKVADAIAEKMAKILEQVDVDDIQCINMMMNLK